MKKILCFILTAIMLISAMPLSVFAADGTSTPAKPIVSVSSLYTHTEGGIQFRALPDNEGVFYFDVKLNPKPQNNEEIIVYYRTVDDSAVSKWGDYVSVGALDEASVILNKANGYTARVVVQSTVLDYGFISDNNRIMTRRFIFELLRVEGNAELSKQGNESRFYCYLRAKKYSYQNHFASHNTNIWKSNMKDLFYKERDELLDYYEEDIAWNPSFTAQFRDETNRIWSEGTANVAYDSWYYSTNSASYLNTPHIQYKGKYSDSVNLHFDDDWANYVASGVCDLGLSINGTIESEFWDSTGEATFHLYYTYQGKQKKALTLYLQGEFDDSKFFGWEHAFEYALEGLTGNNRDDHMDENFIGFTLYDNNENVAYEVKTENRSENALCEGLKKTIKNKYTVELLAEHNEKTKYNDNFTAYYVKLPSDFALADSYSYEFISDSTRESEIRWLENVKLTFALMSGKEPRVAMDSAGNQMVTTNIDTIKENDPIRMSIRFDRAVFAPNPNNNVYITADIYNDLGQPIAQAVRLDLKQLEGSAYYYAWDTLVFEGDFPTSMDGTKIGSLRNIKIVNGDTVIKGFFTKLGLRGGINDIYVDKDFRTPVANLNTTSTGGWTKSRSVDIYVNAEGGARFNDYVTVYYQWVSAKDKDNAPQTYNSKVVFHTKKDGEVVKSVIGSGNGEMYLYLKAVSSYGKSYVSGPYGPFKFDNSSPTMTAGYKDVAGDLKKRTITVDIPADDAGLKSMELFYIPHDSKTGEGVRLVSFDKNDLDGKTELNYEITHDKVNVGVDEDGKIVLDRREITFYWRVADVLGNVNERVGEFKLVFDTNDYLRYGGDSPEIEKIDTTRDYFKNNTSKFDEYSFIYDYSTTEIPEDEVSPDPNKKVNYTISFYIDKNAFEGNDTGTYSVKILYKGTEFTDFSFSKLNNVCSVYFHNTMEPARYDIQLVRSEGDSVRVSEIFHIYTTNGEKDAIETKKKVEAGTLLSNVVYQLSSENPYFYYKDKDGKIQRVYYNDTKQPASFSSFDKAKEYAYYKELGDIHIVQLTEDMAEALQNSTSGHLVKAKDEPVAREGDYWIRYKSEAWQPTAEEESAWVYYYYGTSPELSVDAFSANLLKALNAVANRIAGYGNTVVLTDVSLLGASPETNLLDKNGRPYLAPGQIHAVDELSYQTMCGEMWTSPVGFAADKNIYKGSVYLTSKGEEYLLVGDFALPEDSIFQYKTYEQNESGEPWQILRFEKGESFIDVLKASGPYYIREMAVDGIAEYTIYLDNEAPKVTFFNTDDQGTLKEIPSGGSVDDIRTKDLYIGSISKNECDSLAYVALYKASNLSLVGVYTAADLATAPIRVDDGNYYIVIADRSGNYYTVSVKVSSTNLECTFKEYPDKYIKLTCNRRNDQIRIYQVYLNGELLTSTYKAEETFDKAGVYAIYIQDIYGNEYTKEHRFVRNYPTVTWKYYGSDGKYHTYDEKDTNTNGFVLKQLYDNQYKISTAVKTRFSFSGDYGYEFIGAAPNFTQTIGTETVVTIEAGQSFTLKVYYNKHKDCYSMYSGVVDLTPPSINVSAEVYELRNGEYSLFEEWENGTVGDIVEMEDLYYILSNITNRTVSNGDSISSDIIKLNANDANGLSLIEVYLDGKLIEKQEKKKDTESNFSEIVLNKWGQYRIVAKDTLGNVAEFTFTNGILDFYDCFVDGKEKEQGLHDYLNFELVGDKHVYKKLEYGKKDFKLNVKQDADVFMSVGVHGGANEIYGYRISEGKIYPLTYKIVLDANGNKTVELEVGAAILDMSVKDFKLNTEYLISKTDAYAVYASVGANKIVSIKVYAPEDSSKVVSVSARLEVLGSHIAFVSAELSKKISNISFEGVGIQTKDDIRINNGFVIDESNFESERISSISLYHSKLNDLDASNLAGKSNIYVTDHEYSDEGFYLLIVRNHYGNERVYKIAISKSFGITSSVTFGDGHKIFYSKDYNGALYSNSEIVLDILDEGVTFSATLNGAAYSGFVTKKDGNVMYLVFSDAGKYEVTLTDAYGNTIKRQLEINKSTYTVADNLLTGYNEKALKRKEGYTNQKLSVDKAIYDSAGIYYLAIQYGDTVNVLFDAFAESPISTDKQNLVNIIGTNGDGVYKVICRNRYGAVVTKNIYYRETPTLKLERTTRSKSDPEVYDLSEAMAQGFWSNNTLSFSTDAKTYVFTVNGSVTECPKTLVFENSGELGSFEYVITYIDEYGFEYSFKAYLVRKNVSVDIPADMGAVDIDGILSTKKDVSILFGEQVYASYTRNNGEEIAYRSGDVLRKDGTYHFMVTDYAGNTTMVTIKKDTAVEFSFVDSVSGNVIQNGSVVNSSKIGFKDLNKDNSYIEKVIHNGVIKTDFEGSKFSEDGKWELIICDKIGNRSYFCFYIVTRNQNGFAYTTPHEYRITEMWYDSGDGVRVSYMNLVNHTDFSSSFDFKENGKYVAVMASDITGKTSTFEFTVNTTAPAVTLVGCNNGETTINDVTLTGHQVGDVIRVYRATKTGEELVEEVEVTSLATKIPTITEGGKYRIVVESEAGVQTELSLVRKHVMNTAGSIFVIVVIAVAVIGLFTGLVYRNKSKTDD